MGDGWRATVRIDGALHKGKVRATQLEAHDDAKGLRKLRDEGNADGVNATLGEAMKRALAHCELRRRRPGTVNWYRKQFAILTAEFGEGQKLRLLTKARVQQFVTKRVAEGLAPRTIRHDLQALRRLFYVSDLSPSPVKGLVMPDLEDKAPDVFEWADALRVLDRVRKVDEFEWAVLALFLYTGVRRAEAARIRIVDDENDIDFGQKLLHVKIGKRRPRTLPCPDQLMEVLGVFVDEGKRPRFEEDADTAGDGLFPGTTEARRTGYVRRVFERWAAKLKQPKLHPHTMRHTFGSELARRGVSVSTIAALMGHSLAAAGANAITHLYIQVHGPELRAAMGKLWE